MEVTCTEEAAADILEAMSYLNQRSPTAAASSDADIARCIECLADRECEGQSDGSGRVLSCGIWGRPFRMSPFTREGTTRQYFGGKPTIAARSGVSNPSSLI